MFQSLEYIHSFGYNSTTKLHSYEYELTDSDFGKVVVLFHTPMLHEGDEGAAAGAVIQEYSKRKLNVAANLVAYFRWYEKEYRYPIAQQITWEAKHQPLFTPALKAARQKSLTLL
jgi:hypothetical protein